MLQTVEVKDCSLCKFMFCFDVIFQLGAINQLVL